MLFPLICRGESGLPVLFLRHLGPSPNVYLLDIPKHFCFPDDILSFPVCMPTKCFSHVWLCVTLWTVALQAPLSTGFPRQENWSGLPFPLPGNLPQGIFLIQGSNHCLLCLLHWQVGFFTTSTTCEAPFSSLVKDLIFIFTFIFKDLLWDQVCCICPFC